MARPEIAEKDGAYDLLEEILHRDNLNAAYRRVKQNKGAPGIAGMTVEEMLPYLKENKEKLLENIFEPIFSLQSYGFRPGRSAHQAIRQAKEYYRQGYVKVMDIDLAKYFDTVNHDILLNRIREEVKDERVIKLIRKFLKSGVMINGLYSPKSEGTPQGGNHPLF